MSNVKRLSMAAIAVFVIAAFVLGAIGIQKASAQATQPVWRVDANGNITKDGVIFRIKGASWFGLEGRHEPSNDPTNPSGAPMEQYIGNVFWASSSRTYASDLAEFKAMGINTLRIPLVPQTLTGTNPQGMAPYLKNSPAVVIANSRLALETIIKEANTAGIMILLDIHSCSNYVGWRAGRFDARPPYADKDRTPYDFKRENASCAASGNPAGVTIINAYDSTKWLADLRTLAGLPASLGVTNIMGIDIFNEPWDYTWADWKSYIDQAYTAINAVNPNVLIFAQGISGTANNQDGSPTTITQVPHGSTDTNPNWGENLFEAGANPPTMPKNRLVYSPHVYGPSVFVQKMFMDPAQPQCVGLEGDAAGDAKCNIKINPTLLRTGWQEHFGYLKAQGYAVAIGEWGGNMDWPNKASLYDQARWSFLTDKTVDQQWQTAFVDYLLSVGITDSFYWSVNPESGDTGGLYTTPYDPVSNTGGWGTWGAQDSRKVTLNKRLWDAPFNPGGATATPVTPGVTPATATRTNTPVTPVVATATRTRTATTGPSPTRTRTSTTGPSPTRTNTPVVTNTPITPVVPTNTPVTPVGPTNTPVTPTGGACTPVTSVVTAPYTIDGVSNVCLQIATIPGYINSWNATTVTVNGTTYTNVYVAAGSLPAKINNNYYIKFTSTVAWGHIEIR